MPHGGLLELACTIRGSVLSSHSSVSQKYLSGVVVSHHPVGDRSVHVALSFLSLYIWAVYSLILLHDSLLSHSSQYDGFLGSGWFCLCCCCCSRSNANLSYSWVQAFSHLVSESSVHNAYPSFLDSTTPPSNSSYSSPSFARFPLYLYSCPFPPPSSWSFSCPFLPHFFSDSPLFAREKGFSFASSSFSTILLDQVPSTFHGRGHGTWAKYVPIPPSFSHCGSPLCHPHQMVTLDTTYI